MEDDKAKTAPTTNCVQVFYNAGGLCWYPGSPTTYVAGEQKIVLTGKIPTDKRWDGQFMILTGHLVEYNHCTMFFVDKAVPCGTV